MNDYKHKEAFCLMRYECSNCHHQEIIWNSRDGVTPFGAACPSCDGPLMHVYFASDARSVEHKLKRFQKFWRDGTRKEAIGILSRRYDSGIDADYDFYGETKDEFIDGVLAEGSEFQKGWPLLDICLNATGEIK